MDNSRESIHFQEMPLPPFRQAHMTFLANYVYFSKNIDEGEKAEAESEGCKILLGLLWFQGPFKVICDGTFVHHLLVNRLTPADTALVNTLGATVKIFTTRCVLAELKSLGDSYSKSLNAARSLIIARCEHEKRKSALACITEVIGENNPEHFIVATQATELRKKFQEDSIPGVPVIYGLRNALFLEQPSAFQHQFAKTAEEQRSHMTKLDYKMLSLTKKNSVAIEEAIDSSDANEGKEDHILEMQAMKTSIKRKRSDVKDIVQFKRKITKGSNPLSCKKKKMRGNINASLGKERQNVDDTTRNRSQKRKRSRKRKNAKAIV
ncbi:PIN domain-like family protein [Forsythia ovata]|uniref:PIN domain-like family protein n=1 Tax=Forsythia ovata TaxID=205694 RepID=A0ABD1VJB3_9LAMI